MARSWKIYETNLRLQNILSTALGISPVFAQLLINRDIRTPEQADEFLFGELSSCADSFLMKDMARAVTRIGRAIVEKEKILIYGDYDVDGVASTALLARVFDCLGASYETFIPNRLEDGYGLNIDAVQVFADKGIKLMVTVDCGINSVKEVEAANKRGMDVIITDHHVVKGDERPLAYAIINPHQPDCPYPFNSLAGVGVAYKLAKALLTGKEDIADNHLDLVALGTIADVVPLNGENRILAKNGLRKLRRPEKQGLKALMDVAGIDPERLTCRHVGFILGPRINAMGRIGSADKALELLMCADSEEALSIACMLDKENKNRQSIEKNILQQALERVKNEVDLDKDNIIVLADKDWHAGVIGIVASRLTEEYKKPAILISLDGDIGKGSGRSIAGFDLFEAINGAGEYLIGFGGHKQACGIKIEPDKIDMFREKINEQAEKARGEKETLVPDLQIDMCVPFSYINTKLITELNMLMPYGQNNAEPVFCTKGITVKNAPRSIGKNGFKFLAACGNLTCEAITFRSNEIKRPKAGDTIDLAYVPSINTWNGIDSIQLNIKDLK
ncbi:MAG: single-stranded-DNA-specific exonuclease RecJ [Candidatus Omnitrophota bacterium]